LGIVPLFLRRDRFFAISLEQIPMADRDAGHHLTRIVPASVLEDNVVKRKAGCSVSE